MADTPAQVALDEHALLKARNVVKSHDIATIDYALEVGIRAYLSSLSSEAGDDGQGALVERLRTMPTCSCAGDGTESPNLYEQAADRIEALTALLSTANEHITRQDQGIAELVARAERAEEAFEIAVKERDEAREDIGRAHETFAKLIDVLRDRAEAAERRLAEQGQAQGEAVHKIAQECRYCANTGWFYGDPDLDSYCGCSFGKLREELSPTPPSPEPGKYCSFCDVKFAGEKCPSCQSDTHVSSPEPDAELVEVFKDVLSSLVAAHSLLRDSPKTAAPSNKMFDQMLKDYAASIKRGRAALLAAKSKGGQADG